MAKKILVSAPSQYETSCRECWTHFSYELEDVHKNYTWLPTRYVTCPTCGSMCGHFGQGLRTR